MHFPTPLPVTPIVSQSSLSLVGVPASLAVGETSGSIIVTPVMATFLSGFQMAISCSGTAGTATITSSPLTWAGSSAAALTFHYHRTRECWQPHLQLRAYWQRCGSLRQPGRRPISVVATGSVLVSGWPPSLAVNELSALIVHTPSAAALLSGWTLTMSCTNGGAVNQSMLVWPTGSQAQQAIYFTAPAGAGSVTCTYLQRRLRCSAFPGTIAGDHDDCRSGQLHVHFVGTVAGSWRVDPAFSHAHCRCAAVVSAACGELHQRRDRRLAAHLDHR